MNQIIFDKNSTDTKHKKHSNIVYHFKILFILCIFLLIFLTWYYFYFWNQLDNKEKISDKLKDNFNIAKLYSQTQSYTAPKTLNDYISSDSSFSVIGLIDIPKINISYPILSNINDELLKIAPCRFYGPSPNEIGNLCIAGHNYKNSKFFSKLKNLEKQDIIKIIDLNGNTIEYIIYDKFDTNYEDISCISQDTNKREVTLITCNNIKDNRTIIKAKERE